VRDAIALVSSLDVFLVRNRRNKKQKKKKKEKNFFIIIIKN